MCVINQQDMKKAVTDLIASAPAVMRPACITLLSAAASALAHGGQTELRGVVRSWRDLMVLLSSLASGRQNSEILFRVTSDLLAIGDRMAPPGEVLKESSEILVRALHAEMYVCRLRDRNGFWRLHTVNRVDGGSVPILMPVLEEGLRGHPVMQALAAGGKRYIITNDLHSIERGGGSADCMAYKAGYRSRLTFVLHEHGGEQPFGLVMLFSEREKGFAMYDTEFLARCARIVALTVGRRVAVARDTLEKAAGAMAHYGNNILNIIRNQTEFCGELISRLDEVLARVQTLADSLNARMSGDTVEHRLAGELVSNLAYADLTKLAGNLGKVQDGCTRMTRLINSLRKSAERPRLMHYALGHDVLELEPEHEGGRTPEHDISDAGRRL